MWHATPKAATRPEKSDQAADSAEELRRMARKANTRGDADALKPAMVAENPPPPHQPSTFCAPWAKNTMPNTPAASSIRDTFAGCTTALDI